MGSRSRIPSGIHVSPINGKVLKARPASLPATKAPDITVAPIKNTLRRENLLISLEYLTAAEGSFSAKLFKLALGFKRSNPDHNISIKSQK
jgi:hypothetical protein